MNFGTTSHLVEVDPYACSAHLDMAGISYEPSSALKIMPCLATFRHWARVARIDANLQNDPNTIFRVCNRKVGGSIHVDGVLLQYDFCFSLACLDTL